MSGGQRSEVRGLCDHVLLTFVESDLAERDGAHRHVDAGGDEAVDADLVVQTVDVLRRTFTAEQKNNVSVTAAEITLIIQDWSLKYSS